MWICSNLGFFSIVKEGPPGAWQVRARVESDLRELLEASGLKTEIVATPSNDHAFRLVVDHDGLDRVFTALAESIGYPNFKECLESLPRQRDKLPAYADFWSAMRKVQNETIRALAATSPAAEAVTSAAIVRRKGGNLARLLETLNGFHEKYGHWPTKLRLPPAMLKSLRTTHLTPLGFQRLEGRLQLVEGKHDKLIAEDDAGLAFDYGKEGYSGKRSPAGADDWVWRLKI